MKLVLAVVLAVVLGGAHAGRWLGRTSYDNAFTKYCGNDEVIYRIQSQHSNKKEDRWWNFYCQGGYNLNDNTRSWSGYKNDFDKPVDFNCGTNKALVGFSSYHSNKAEDRRWKFQCKTLSGLQTKNCRFDSWANNWDGGMDRSVGSINKVLNGVYSYHNNKKEDRRMKMKVCDVCSLSVVWTSWSSWSRCPRSCTPPGVSPSSHTRTRRCSSRYSQSVCSGINCRTATERRLCNEKVTCPALVNGGWSCWSDWGKCSNRCGTGRRTRTRSCNNPPRQSGGANCPGASSQTKPCHTISFHTFVSSSISGYVKKTLTNKSQYECTMACIGERSFSCKSLQYYTASNKCILKDRDRSNGGRLSTSTTYQGQVYMERTCGVNSAETVRRPSHNPFVDRCHLTNCYSACGESPYGNELRTGTDIKVRGVMIDLYAALNDGTIPSSAKKVTVYAQTVTLARTLDIKYDLVIVARQVYFTSSGQIRYVSSGRGTQVISSCKTQTLRPDCASGKTMTLRSYYGNGRLDIYAEGISIARGSCSTGRIITHLPKQDTQALRQAMACSQVLRMRTSTGYDRVADNILSYIQLVSNDQSVFASRAEATSIGALAGQLRSEMKLRSRSGERYLPVLSQSSYVYILSKYSQIFNAFNQRYTTAFDSRTSVANRLESLQAIVTQADAAGNIQQRKAENAAAAVQESTLTLGKLKSEFDKANKELKKAQDTLEEGVEAYKKKMIAKTVFSFFNVIGQLFKAVSQIVIGAITGNVAMVVGGVGDLIASIAELAMLIQDTIELANTIKGITATADDIGKMISTLKAPDNAQEILHSVEEAAESRVKIVVWQNIKNTADIQLGSGTITEIGGCDGFRKALADVANWGKALSEQVLNHADLTRSYIVESLALEVARSDIARMRSLYQTAQSQRKVSDELLAKASEQIAGVQMSAIRTMVDYCNTYYYYNYKQCGNDYTFKLSDQLHTLQVKIQRMANDKLNSASAFVQNPPHPFVAAHILKDLDTSTCNNPARCPITQLKLNRQLQFNIPITSPELTAHERVRVTQVRIYLSGVKFLRSSKRLSVQLNNAGVIRDRYQNKEYKFTGVGRQLFFTYNYDSHTTTDYACVHSSVSGVLFELTPFGDWALQVMNPPTDVDLSSLSQIEIYFLGNSIANRKAVPKAPVNKRFGKYGEQGMSGECIGRHSRKRSIMRK